MITDEQIKQGVLEAFKEEKDNWLEARVARHFYKKGQIELLDKAIKWLYEHREEVQTEDNGITGWIPDEFIMDFKQAMET